MIISHLLQGARRRIGGRLRGRGREGGHVVELAARQVGPVEHAEHHDPGQEAHAQHAEHRREGQRGQGGQQADGGQDGARNGEEDRLVLKRTKVRPRHHRRELRGGATNHLTSLIVSNVSIING